MHMIGCHDCRILFGSAAISGIRNVGFSIERVIAELDRTAETFSTAITGLQGTDILRLTSRVAGVLITC